jgi:hypothetical protein
MNRAISAAAFLCLVLFLGVLVYRLRLIDLTVVILITLGLAGYDLWLQLYRRRRR